MSRFWIFLTLLFLPSVGAITKLAFIGDSITTGAGAPNRKEGGFVAVARGLLGENFEVQGFALGGHTLLRAGDSPLVSKPVYQKALAFEPDVAVIMLGTNDTVEGKRKNWRHHADLEKDVLTMVAQLRTANPKVLIHLAGPPPMFAKKKGLSTSRAADLTERSPRLKVVADVFDKVAKEEMGVLSHDLSRVFGADETTDGVHPNGKGHRLLGEYFSDLMRVSFEEKTDVSQCLLDAKCELKTSEFYGFQKEEFVFKGEKDCAATVVIPRQAAEGQPWIWRARFFGHQPALDLELLDRGWHLAYVDVSDLFGNEEAFQIWDSFYLFATEKLGLGKRPVLEGMSRGGLVVFRWAALNPDKVSAVYGDNPVLDFRTWPGGRDGGKKSDRNWRALLNAWSLTEEEAWKLTPVLDSLPSLVEQKVPVALVLGTADEVVPNKANGEVVAEVYQASQAPLKIWRKEGFGHHPHGLNPPKLLREFLEEAFQD